MAFHFCLKLQTCRNSSPHQKAVNTKLSCEGLLHRNTSSHRVLDPLCSLVWFVNKSWNFLFIFLWQQKFLLLNIMHRWMFYKHSWLPWRVEQQTNKKIDKVKWCMTWTEYFIRKICCISATIGYFIIDSLPVLVNRTSFRQAIIYWVHFTPVARKIWTSTWNRADGNSFHSEKSETRKFNLKVLNFKRILHLTLCQLTNCTLLCQPANFNWL